MLLPTNAEETGIWPTTSHTCCLQIVPAAFLEEHPHDTVTDHDVDFGLHPWLPAPSCPCPWDPLNLGATEHPGSIRSLRPELRKLFPSPITARPLAPQRGTSEVTLVSPPPPWLLSPRRGRAHCPTHAPSCRRVSPAASGAGSFWLRLLGKRQQKKIHTSGTVSNRKASARRRERPTNPKSLQGARRQMFSKEGTTGIHRRMAPLARGTDPQERGQLLVLCPNLQDGRGEGLEVESITCGQ